MITSPFCGVSPLTDVTGRLIRNSGALRLGGPAAEAVGVGGVLWLGGGTLVVGVGERLGPAFGGVDPCELPDATKNMPLTMAPITTKIPVTTAAFTPSGCRDHQDCGPDVEFMSLFQKETSGQPKPPQHKHQPRRPGRRRR